MMVSQQQQSTNGKTIWDHAKSAGKRASITGQKAKTRTEMLLLDKKIKTRKQNFGVDLYDLLQRCVDHDPQLLIDSPALENIQGLFVTTYKENRALVQKKALQQEKMEQLDKERKVLNSRHGGTLSFDVPADTFGERVLRAPAAARISGTETKLKAAVASMDQYILANKQQFGIDCYDLLVKLETFNHWMPDDKDVRFFYDQARRDVARWQLLKEEKYEDLEVLDQEAF